MHKLEVVIRKSVDREWDGNVAGELLPYIHIAQGDAGKIWELFQEHHTAASRFTFADIDTALTNLEKWDMLTIRWPRENGGKKTYALTPLGAFHLRQQLMTYRPDMTYRVKYG